MLYFLVLCKLNFMFVCKIWTFLNDIFLWLKKTLRGKLWPKSGFANVKLGNDTGIGDLDKKCCLLIQAVTTVKVFAIIEEQRQNITFIFRFKHLSSLVCSISHTSENSNLFAGPMPIIISHLHLVF